MSRDSGAGQSGHIRLEQSYRSAYFVGWFGVAGCLALSIYFTVDILWNSSGAIGAQIWLAPAMVVPGAVLFMLFELVPVRSVCIDRVTGAIQVDGAFGRRNQWSIGDVRAAGLRTWWNRPDTLVLQGDNRRLVLQTGPIPEVQEFLDELAAIQHRLGIELAPRRTGEAVAVRGAALPTPAEARRADRSVRKSTGYRLIIDGVVADGYGNVPSGDDEPPVAMVGSAQPKKEVVLDRRWSDLYTVVVTTAVGGAIVLMVGVVGMIFTARAATFAVLVATGALSLAFGMAFASAVRRIELDVASGEVHATGMRKRWRVGTVGEGVVVAKKRRVGTMLSVGDEGVTIHSGATPAVLGFVDRLRAAAEQHGATAQVDLERPAATTKSPWRLVMDE